MKRRWILRLVCGWMCALLCGCATAENAQIVTTSFPCYDLVRQVVGEAADVQMLIRPGAEVHSYEPSPADMLSIGGAELFVCIGGESDVWVDSILDSLGERAPECLRLIESVDALSEEEHDHEHEGLELDEHIWTSPKNALKMLRAVEEALCAQIPEQAEQLCANADAYAAELEQIDAELTRIVEDGKRNELVFADRFPFLYLAHDYGLTYEAAFASCSSETEVSAQTLVKLIQTIQDDEIPVVYTIEMSNGAIARTIAEETGAEVLELHSIQTVTQDEWNAGESYASLMRKNLAAIEKGLN